MASVLKLVVTATIATIVAASHTAAQKPAFEVASVKPSRTTNAPGSISTAGGHLLAINVPLRPMLKIAYRPPDGQLFDYQLIGAPGWIDIDHFDIEGTPGPQRPVSRAQFQLMLQSLLEDRFRLKAHRETRELPVYNLVTKGLPKIQLSEDQTPPVPVESPDSGPLPRGSYQSRSDASGTMISAKAIPISTLIALLQSKVDRRIVDKTNLKALYDINLHFKVDSLSAAPDVIPSDPNALSILTSIDEQLGSGWKAPKGL